MHKANAKLGRKIPTYVMNPKAMPREISPYISPTTPLYLPISPCISPYLPISPYTSPKAMPREQLLGHMDMDTREWFDGVLTASARKVVRVRVRVRG